MLKKTSKIRLSYIELDLVLIDFMRDFMWDINYSDKYVMGCLRIFLNDIRDRDDSLFQTLSNVDQFTFDKYMKPGFLDGESQVSDSVKKTLLRLIFDLRLDEKDFHEFLIYMKNKENKGEEEKHSGDGRGGVNVRLSGGSFQSDVFIGNGQVTVNKG